MVVVGAGNLGRALALHDEFQRRGFNICGIFDCDARKIGKKIGRLTIQNVRAIPTVVRNNRIDVGVIAVPAAIAQSVADILIASRIRGLLNMAQTHVVSPRHVPVVDVRIVASLQELAHSISRMRRRPS
jgi:redox-sensing transcriptional repressor